MKNTHYRLPVMMIVLFLLVHSSFSYYDVGSCSINDIGVYDILACKFKLLTKALIVVVLFVLNEMFIYKITQNSFPKWLVTGLIFLALGSGLIILSLLALDKYSYNYGDAGMGLLMIFWYSIMALIFAVVYLFRLIIQKLFSNFFQRFYYFISIIRRRGAFLVLERYFYSIFIVSISISVLLYVVTFIALTSV